MAYSSAALSATLLARLANDKPLTVGNNHLFGRTTATVQWRASGSWASGASAPDANGPVTRLWDGFAHNLRSYPASSVDPWYLIIDFGAGGVTIDSVAIIDHNLDDIAGMVVSFQIADDNAYTSNLITLDTWTPGTSDKRLTSFELMHTGTDAREYTSVRYARFVFNPTAGAVPAIGEIVIGQRQHFPYAPNEPHNPRSKKSYGASFRSASRVKTFYAQAKGQQIADVTLEFDNETDIADAVALFDEDHTDFGAHPFLWVPNPSTASQAAYLMTFTDDEPEFVAPYVDGPRVEWSWSAEEQPTFVSAEH